MVARPQVAFHVHSSRGSRGSAQAPSAVRGRSSSSHSPAAASQPRHRPRPGPAGRRCHRGHAATRLPETWTASVRRLPDARRQFLRLSKWQRGPGTTHFGAGPGRGRGRGWRGGRVLDGSGRRGQGLSLEQRGGWGLGWVRGGAWLERVMPRLSKEQGLERMSGTISIASEAEARTGPGKTKPGTRGSQRLGSGVGLWK